ncbi:MAG: hypothetical protein LBF08_08440 [Dysgonamonadaceae bacterium]|nr:hypothetical protein [Dysgonamonadaceae bacterium]
MKSRVLLAVIFSIAITGSVYSQGVFRNKPAKAAADETITMKPSGVFGSGGVKPDPTGGDNCPPNENSPVGEGLAILSILSGGYFLLKRSNRKK